MADRYTPEARASIERLQAAGFDFAEADMIYHGDMLGAALGAKVAAAIASLREERDALRQIISECATATRTGIAPTASLGFMRLLPAEIASVRVSAERERDEARALNNRYAWERDKAREERDQAERNAEAFWKPQLDAARALSPTQKPGNGE